MTLAECMTLALKNAGLNTSTTTFKDSARNYINLGLKELCGRKQWRWLYADGTITTTATEDEYDLANDVVVPISFRNVTDDFEMQMVDQLKLDRVDPDTDLTAGGEKAAIVAWNGTNKNWTVNIWPIPDTSSETIKYRYYKYISDFTSGDDATELDVLGVPEWTQTALMYYAASKIMQEKQDHEGAMQAMGTFEQQIQFYIDLDAKLEGAQGTVTHLQRADAFGFGEFQFKVNGGGLS